MFVTVIVTYKTYSKGNISAKKIFLFTNHSCKLTSFKSYFTGLYANEDVATEILGE